MNANNAQITVRKGERPNDPDIPLSEAASRNAENFDKGGTSTDKVTIYYERPRRVRSSSKGNPRSHLIRGAATCFACLRFATFLSLHPAELTALIHKYTLRIQGTGIPVRRACAACGLRLFGTRGRRGICADGAARKIIISGAHHRG